MAEEAEARVNVVALAVAGDEERAFLRGFAGVVAGEERGELGAPRGAEIGAALLDPTGPIGGG